MSAERREQLKRKAGRRLNGAIRKVIRSAKPSTIDIEMFWPPDHDEINFLVQADWQPTEWDFAIPTSHWRLPHDRDDDAPSDLLADIRSFFRATWRQIRTQHSSDARAYLRLHEEESSIDLRNGRRINDCDRPAYTEPSRVPFNQRRRSTRKKRRNGELVRRGDSLSKLKRAYKISEGPEEGQYYWADQGVRIEIRKGRIDHIFYFDPFHHSICGIWIGAHAWEADEILGRAKTECWVGPIGKATRLWQYDCDGFMSVGFDMDDTVKFIGRCPSVTAGFGFRSIGDRTDILRRSVARWKFPNVVSL